MIGRGAWRWLRGALTPVALFVVAFALILWVSRGIDRTPVERSFFQEARACGLWIDKIAREGVAAWGQPTRDAALVSVQAKAQLPALISGMVWQAAYLHHPWLSEVIALRFGSLVIAALAFPLVYLLVAPLLGRGVALFSVAFLAFVPRALQQAATAETSAMVVTAWLAVTVCYIRSVREQSGTWTLLTGLCFGLSLAVNAAVVLVVVLLVAHTLWLKRVEARRAVRGGQIPVPSALLAMALFGPPMFLIGTPWLWHDTATRLRQLGMASLAPAARPVLYDGTLIGAPPFPSLFALKSTLLSVPTVTIALAAVGAAVLARRAFAKRGDAAGAGDHEVGLGALLAIGTIVALGWPIVSPGMLSVFPPRWTLALPFVAIAAGIGLDASLRLAGALLESTRGRWKVGLPAAYGATVLGVLCFESVRKPETLGAAYAALLGGPGRVVRSRELPVNDNLPMLSLARAIDGLRRPSVSVYSPDTAPDVWEGLRESGQMQTSVRVTANGRDADVVLVPGDPSGNAVVQALWLKYGSPPVLLAAVERDGAALQVLYRVGAR